MTDVPNQKKEAFFSTEDIQYVQELQRLNISGQILILIYIQHATMTTIKLQTELNDFPELLNESWNKNHLFPQKASLLSEVRQHSPSAK